MISFLLKHKNWFEFFINATVVLLWENKGLKPLKCTGTRVCFTFKLQLRAFDAIARQLFYYPGITFNIFSLQWKLSSQTSIKFIPEFLMYPDVARRSSINILCGSLTFFRENWHRLRIDKKFVTKCKRISYNMHFAIISHLWFENSWVLSTSQCV